MSTLGARRITELSLAIPSSGAWIGEAILDSGDMPTPGAATLTIGDLTCACRVLPSRGGLDAPARPHLVLANGHGWLQVLRGPDGDPIAGSFTSTTAIRLSTVLAELARLTGETVATAPEVKLGKDYGWPAGATGADVLADLVSRGALPRWRMTPSGVTAFSPWPATGAADPYGVIQDRDLARGVRFVALNSRIAAWLPGATVQNVSVARGIVEEREGETRVTTWET